jgi:hypothetical protein
MQFNISGSWLSLVIMVTVSYLIPFKAVNPKLSFLFCFPDVTQQMLQNATKANLVKDPRVHSNGEKMSGKAHFKAAKTLNITSLY